AGDVEFAARARRARAAPCALGAADVGRDGDWTPAERADRGSLPYRRRRAVLELHATVAAAPDLDAIEAAFGNSALSADRRAVARAGNDSESAVSRFHDAQRAGLLPRLFLVLFHQRAPAAVSEHALPARLQHGAAALLLAVSPALAVPVERLSTSVRLAAQRGRACSDTRIPHADAHSMLGRFHSGLLHT